ncbi:MAG TPA: alpha/beta hydrolase [Aliidongia sp.]|nr:alpha/beta hydrolase [Aliidongia sp.]
MRHFFKSAALVFMAGILAHPAIAASDAVPDAATDPRIDPQIRSFLANVNKDPSPFWTLPGPQVRAVLTGLQNKTKVDMSGVATTEKTISENGQTVKLYVTKPEKAHAALPVILFIHGGVWIAGDFENHQRLVRDLVVGTGAAAVSVEYTPIPDAVYPTQVEQSYAAAKWVAAHGAEIGLDGSRMAVAGNSVGGDMSAALTLMAKDRGGPSIRYQVLLIPATDASVDTDSYHQFATGRFLARDFMKFGWDIYAPDEKTRNLPYVSPLRATLEQLHGLPPALVITAENDPLRDEGEAYARKLKDAGVPVIATRYDGMIHDFVLLNGIQDDPGPKAAIQQACDQLKAVLFR